ncbi:hypothetical protein RUND412_000281 [Rhizina undulata]
MFLSARNLGLAGVLFGPLLCSAASSGTLKVLTYNVAGLPEALSSSDPEEDTPYISARLSPYELIHVQEDFNYHAALYASDSHPYRTPTSGGVPLGDGLNTLSNYPYIDFERTTWDDCYLNSGDCLTPKGFTAMRVQLDTNVWVDVYNLHTDAGGETGDLSARSSNVNQLVTYMSTYSAGMPMILMGDTNMRYTTSGDSIRTLVSGGGFTDSWVQLWQSGTPPALGSTALTCDFPFASTVTDQATMCACETVDKILYRSTSILTLTPTSFTNEDLNFINPSTSEPLSDHYPLSVDFAWTASSSLRLSPVVGGPHGDWFNDVTTLASSTTLPTMTTLTIAGGSRLDSVTAAYNSISSITHGGTGGDAVSITLNSGETIVEVEGCQGQKDGDTRVFYLKVTTSSGRELAAGTATDTCTTMTAPETGFRVVGFWGRSGDEVDRLGVIWGK